MIYWRADWGDLVMARQKIELAAEEAEELSRRARATTVSVRDRQRAEIIVLSAQGQTQQRIAEQLGISPASVQRLWAASDIKPHLSRTFKLSNDTRFEEKFWDVIGLYLNPPDKALVLCCDEKSQCQALERTQPGLPLGIGHIRTKTHDYVRHGTLTLFAALNYLEGKLITRLAARHRHQEWLAFLKTIDAETPGDLAIHIIADNDATHKHPRSPDGWTGAPAFTCTTRRPRPPG